ncbi:zebrafish testis-expressed 38 isoform X1 [Salvelinus sp. IW2-2015]|uniref:zebrafish testis-expressed 38 isoform X1 n=1 Tax=Salvelinus sp. IW2-2015 TaxID=2691554 RepID=UPI000CDFE197|nr:HORMA domain-containing protein 1 isoform X1 [Salvelinus alpinus]
MAAGKMCSRPKKQETAEWTSLFQNELKTEEKSLVFVKRMMALAVSSITYLRGIFPEDAYRSRYLEDLCIKVLREDCTTPGVCKIVKWLMGCFDALERGYLQVVFIGVCTNPDNPNCIIESYQFKFTYTDKGPQMDILRNQNVEMQITMEDTKKASVLLIRKLFLLMQNLDVLPNDVCLTMKLYYFDDITPADYEPPGFKEGVNDNLWFEGMAVHFRVGEVHTPFHTLKVRVAAEQGRVEKLQEGNYLKESQVSTATQSTLPGLAPTGAQDPDNERYKEDDFPSEDESAQFKKPKKPVAKVSEFVGSWLVVINNGFRVVYLEEKKIELHG